MIGGRLLYRGPSVHGRHVLIILMLLLAKGFAIFCVTELPSTRPEGLVRREAFTPTGLRLARVNHFFRQNHWSLRYHIPRRGRRAPKRL